jgi:hypothetical protein
MAITSAIKHRSKAWANDRLEEIFLRTSAVSTLHAFVCCAHSSRLAGRSAQGIGAPPACPRTG